LGLYPAADPGYPQPEDGSRVIGVLHKVFARGPSRNKDVLDGTSKTIIVIESAGKPDMYTKGALGNALGMQVRVSAGTGWADPDSGFTVNTNPMINNHNDAEIYSFHSGGAQACFADGSTHFLSDSIDPAAGVALVTRAGGEVASSDSY
jgi:prepilin-type processing-associated H-X9-DG protein